MIAVVSKPYSLTDGQLRAVSLGLGIGEFATELAMRPRHAMVDRHGGAVHQSRSEVALRHTCTTVKSGLGYG